MGSKCSRIILHYHRLGGEGTGDSTEPWGLECVLGLVLGHYTRD